MSSEPTNAKHPAAASDNNSIAPSEATITFETHSVVPSELTITDPPLPQYVHGSVNHVYQEDNPNRFTAIGKPMPEREFSGGLAVMGGATAFSDNHVPWKFKDTSFLSIPIRQTDLDEALAEAPARADPPSYGADANNTLPVPPAAEEASSGKRRKFFFFSSLGKSKSRESKKPAFQTIKMTRAEYLAFFAKDENGAYICTEPRESGAWKQVLRMRKEDRELQAAGRTDTRFVNGVEVILGGGGMM